MDGFLRVCVYVQTHRGEREGLEFMVCWNLLIYSLTQGKLAMIRVFTPWKSVMPQTQLMIIYSFSRDLISVLSAYPLGEINYKIQRKERK